jgi:hypothetical protein
MIRQRRGLSLAGFDQRQIGRTDHPQVGTVRGVPHQI